VQPDQPKLQDLTAKSAVAPFTRENTSFRIQRDPVAGGAELVTLFGKLGDPASASDRLEVPIVSVLRDTLGSSDPETQRLRYIWILTSTRPTPLQRLASAFSFLCFRTGTKHHSTSVPSPALDLAAPGKSVLPNLLGKGLQSTEFDPLGVMVRTSTRSYRGNASDYKKLHLYQALDALDGLERSVEDLSGADPLVRSRRPRRLVEEIDKAPKSGSGGTRADQGVRPTGVFITMGGPQAQGHSPEGFPGSVHGSVNDGRDILPEAQLREIYSRLRLSDRTFGGLLRQDKLAKYYGKETGRRHETLGHNWELLRQRAELAGLYFQPLALQDAAPTQALLWVARKDLEAPEKQRFDRQFLNIANPWTDERLQHWTGYTEVRYLDADNREVRQDAPDARPVEMTLDHPRVPLLVADFRNNLKPKRSELIRHCASSLVTGVFGFTRFGNWPFFVGDSAYTFVRTRHGAATDRSARLEAYSDARNFLALDTSLDPKLRAELLHRVDHLALNPLENGIATEVNVATEQYAALLRYAESDRGFVAKLDRDHRKELDSYTKSGASRFFGNIGRFLIGPSPTEKSGPQLQIQLAGFRSSAYHMRFLEQVLASSPRPEVAWDRNAIRQSVEALASSAPSSPRAARLIAQVFQTSGDFDLRFSCLRALHSLDIEVAHNELWRLSQNPANGDSWRAICLLYFQGHTPASQVAAMGGGL
jgi:hypothetical protein